MIVGFTIMTEGLRSQNNNNEFEEVLTRLNESQKQLQEDLHGIQTSILDILSLASHVSTMEV